MNHADSTKEEKFTHVYAFICTITLILATYFTFIPKPVESNLKLDQSNNKLSYINSLSTQMQNSDFSDEFKDYLSISRPFMTLPTDNDPLLKKLDVGFYDRSQEVSYKLINTDVSFKVPIEETIITLPEPLSIDQILPTVDLSVAKNQTLLSPLSSEEITPPVSLAWQVSPAFKNDFLNAPEEDLIPASEIFVTGSTVIQVNSQTITPFIKNIPVISIFISEIVISIFIIGILSLNSHSVQDRILNIGIKKTDIISLFHELQKLNPFLKYTDNDETLDFFSVQNSNYCKIKIFNHHSEDKIIIVSAIDNLIKGAAGQAVQCFNIAENIEETVSLV